MKKIIGVYSAPRQHWVGDGFPVRSLFSYHSHGKTLSPFLLLDRAGPAEFAPTSQPRGVGQHPHGGFETVTMSFIVARPPVEPRIRMTRTEAPGRTIRYTHEVVR